MNKGTIKNGIKFGCLNARSICNKTPGGGVPMANYGELWRIMAKVFMANWAKLNCAIRHNSP